MQSCLIAIYLLFAIKPSILRSTFADSTPLLVLCWRHNRVAGVHDDAACEGVEREVKELS